MKKIILTTLLTAGLMHAQEARLLTLQDAVNYALENKADALKARKDIERAEAKIREVRGNVFPQISVNSATNYNPLLQQSLLPGELAGMPGQKVPVTFGTKWNSTNVAQMQQLIFNEQVFTGLKAARSTREFYQLNAQLTDENLIERVANAYYQVYKTDQMMKNMQENLSLTQQTSKVIKGLLDAGLARKIDYDRIVVAENNIASTVKTLENATQLAENALKFYMGMDIAQPIRLPQDTFEPKYLPGEQTQYDERSEIKLAKKQIELLQWQKRASESEYYPVVALTANYGWLGQGAKFPWWHGEKDGVYWNDFSQIGLNINIPIFRGFSVKSRIEQNQIDIEKAQLDLKDTKMGLDMQYQNAITKLQNNMTQIEIQQGNVKLAEDVMNNTRSNYQYGLATMNDIVDAESDLAEAKNNYTNALLEYKMAEVELLKSQGRLRTLTQ